MKKLISALLITATLYFPLITTTYADDNTTNCQTLTLHVINNSGHPLSFSGFKNPNDVRANFMSSFSKKDFLGTINANVMAPRDNLYLTAYFTDDQANVIALNVFDPDNIYIGLPTFGISKIQNYNSTSKILLRGNNAPQCQVVTSATVYIK